jgi:hypothetical protein
VVGAAVCDRRHVPCFERLLRHISATAVAGTDRISLAKRGIPKPESKGRIEPTPALFCMRVLHGLAIYLHGRTFLFVTLHFAFSWKFLGTRLASESFFSHVEDFTE